MFDFILNNFKKEYQTLNRIEIAREALISNYKYLSGLSPNFKVAPVLKSNAYGHGITLVSKVLDSLGVPFFCVDSLYEAYELYKENIQTPVLITGYTHPENLKVKKLPFSYAVYDLEMARVINDFQPGAGVHIKLDTGMHRLGIPMDGLQKFLDGLKKLTNLKTEGVMAHLALAQKSNSLYQTQINNFIKALEIIRKNGFHPAWIHTSASEGLLSPATRKEVSQISNLVRCGISLYGISARKDDHLKPVLKLTTKIAQVKRVRAGERVGHDGTYKAKQNITLGVLSIGYYDGLDRRLSNKGVVLVNGVKCPIAGRVSMNITTVDLSKVKNPMINQEVVVFSNQSSDPNSIKKAAQTCQTIPYDLLVHLAESTRRVIV